MRLWRLLFPEGRARARAHGEANGYQAALLQAVEAVNDRQKDLLFSKIERHFAGQIQGKTFALWGLAFKPNTDDMREASSRRLMEQLWAAGARVRAFDPVAAAEAQRLYGERADLELVNNRMDAIEGADALVIVTEWSEFRSPDFSAIKAQLRSPVIFDGRNLFDPAQVTSAGLTYVSIGREPAFSA